MFVFCSFVISIDHCALSIIVIVGFSLKFSHMRKLIENYSLFFACFTLGVSRFIAHFLYVCCTWSLQVDGLTKAQEEGYTYKHYFGSAHHQAYADDYQWVESIFVFKFIVPIISVFSVSVSKILPSLHMDVTVSKYTVQWSFDESSQDWFYESLWSSMNSSAVHISNC